MEDFLLCESQRFKKNVDHICPTLLKTLMDNFFLPGQNHTSLGLHNFVITELLYLKLVCVLKGALLSVVISAGYG